MVCDCGTPWTFLLPFLEQTQRNSLNNCLFSIAPDKELFLVSLENICCGYGASNEYPQHMFSDEISKIFS